MENNFKEYKDLLGQPITNDTEDLVFSFSFTREAGGTFQVVNKAHQTTYHGSFSLKIEGEECTIGLRASNFEFLYEQGSKTLIRDEFYKTINHLKTELVPVKLENF